MSSMKRNTAAEKPPSRRFALSTMASNTGCTFDGELEITFRISAVAVWRSSASCVSSWAARSWRFSPVISDLGPADLRLPGLGAPADLGREDLGLRAGFARLGAAARFIAFRLAVAIRHSRARP